ncbi:MAG: hypothetical protein ACP5NB_12820 [Chloroflexia bacterium]
MTVTVTLSNQGCISLYNVSYGPGSIYVSGGESSPLILDKAREGILSQTPLGPGVSGSHQFIYRAVKPGWTIFTGEADYLVILDADDWYIETVKSTPLTIIVTP